MRGIVAVVVCALAAPAAADPPTEVVAKSAARAWMAAARARDGAALARASAPTVRVEISDEYGCPVKTVARSRRAIEQVARRLGRCVPAVPDAWWIANPPVGDTLDVGFSTTDLERAEIVALTIDRDGRVASVRLSIFRGDDAD
jgi:hypothetical protein